MVSNALVSYLNWLTGASTAALHFSAAIKSLPFFRNTPIDVTFFFFSTATVACVIRMFYATIEIRRSAVRHLLLQAMFAYWLILSACWSQSQNISLQKLFDITLLAPLFTFMAFHVIGNIHSFYSFLQVCLYIAVAISVIFPASFYFKLAIIGGPLDTDLLRVQYQIVGQNLAVASCILACRFAYKRELISSTKIFLIVLFITVLGSIGARAAFFGVFFALIFAPASILYLLNKKRTAVFLILIVPFVLFSFVAAFYKLNTFGLTPFTVLRILSALAEQGGVRLFLWRSGVAQHRVSGLGVGGFAPTAGFGDTRRWYPHNVWLESYAEGGIPGLFIFSAILGNALIGFVLRRRKILPLHFGIILGCMIISFSQMMTSSDLGNRMIWFWLGLLFAGEVDIRSQFELDKSNLPATIIKNEGPDLAKW